MASGSPIDDAERRVLDGELWDQLVAHVAALKELVWSDAVAADARLRAEGARYLLRFLAAGIAACVEFDDPDRPELGCYIEDRMSWGLDNPDCNYSYTRVRGDRTYRITGDRGSARHLELQVNTGHMSDGDFAGWRAVSALAGDDLTVGPDGEVDITLSAERPAAGDWMRLDDTASFLLVRQYFADWDHEVPADLTVEVADAALPPPPLQADRLAAHVDLLGQWLDVGARCWDAISRGILGAEPGPITPFRPPDEASGLKGQAYGMGPFRCAPDEAVILECTPPAARMWGVSLCDRFWQSIDIADRQSSLNSAQATLTDDGRFVAVISHDDPGVANWLDPGGHTEGTLAVRYLLPETVPPLDYRTVPRSGLADALPADTPGCSPAERTGVLARRRRALARRYRR
jgi:hypothetical protein